jgi:hypothetical protein
VAAGQRAVQEHAGAQQAGTDLMKLRFGRKLFGQIFILKFWKKVLSKNKCIW